MKKLSFFRDSDNDSQYDYGVPVHVYCFHWCCKSGTKAGEAQRQLSKHNTFNLQANLCSLHACPLQSKL